jgi:hypothetical protein
VVVPDIRHEASDRAAEPLRSLHTSPAHGPRGVRSVHPLPLGVWRTYAHSRPASAPSRRTPTRSLPSGGSARTSVEPVDREGRHAALRHTFRIAAEGGIRVCRWSWGLSAADVSGHTPVASNTLPRRLRLLPEAPTDGVEDRE